MSYPPQIQFLPPKQSLCNSSRPLGTVIVVIMLKLMLHSYSCVSCIVIRFFFPRLKFLFKCFFGAWRLMTTCFPTEMFNQRLIRGTDTFSSADLIFHFPFWCPTFINLQSRGDEEAADRLPGAHGNIDFTYIVTNKYLSVMHSGGRSTEIFNNTI